MIPSPTHKKSSAGENAGACFWIYVVTSVSFLDSRDPRLQLCRNFKTYNGQKCPDNSNESIKGQCLADNAIGIHVTYSWPDEPNTTKINREQMSPGDPISREMDRLEMIQESVHCSLKWTHNRSMTQNISWKKNSASSSFWTPWLLERY